MMGRPKAGMTFWDRVNAQVTESGECRLFMGHRNQDGYGRIRMGAKLVFVHREVWRLNRGEIPDGMCVCHSCDTPNCISPAHLWLGTHLQNMQDRNRKGRQARLYGNTHTKGKRLNRGKAHVSHTGYGS